MDSRTCAREWEASPSTYILLHSHQGHRLPWTLCPHWYCSVSKSCLTLVITCMAAKQASLSFTMSRSFLILMSIESVMPSHHLILLTLLLLSTIFPSIVVSSNELALHIMWPKCCSFIFSIGLSIEYCSTTSKTNLMFPITKQY